MSILNTEVSIEKPHKKKCDSLQCHICQSYVYTWDNGHHEPRCVKCGENYRENYGKIYSRVE
jgi:hypothetical protein